MCRKDVMSAAACRCSTGWSNFVDLPSCIVVICSFLYVCCMRVKGADGERETLLVYGFIAVLLLCCTSLSC